MTSANSSSAAICQDKGLQCVKTVESPHNKTFKFKNYQAIQTMKSQLTLPNKLQNLLGADCPVASLIECLVKSKLLYGNKFQLLMRDK